MNPLTTRARVQPALLLIALILVYLSAASRSVEGACGRTRVMRRRMRLKFGHGGELSRIEANGEVRGGAKTFVMTDIQISSRLLATMSSVKVESSGTCTFALSLWEAGVSGVPARVMPVAVSERWEHSGSRHVNVTELRYHDGSAAETPFMLPQLLDSGQERCLHIALTVYGGDKCESVQGVRMCQGSSSNSGLLFYHSVKKLFRSMSEPSILEQMPKFQVSFNGDSQQDAGDRRRAYSRGLQCRASGDQTLRAGNNTGTESARQPNNDNGEEPRIDENESGDSSAHQPTDIPPLPGITIDDPQQRTESGDATSTERSGIGPHPTSAGNLWQPTAPTEVSRGPATQDNPNTVTDASLGETLATVPADPRQSTLLYVLTATALLLGIVASVSVAVVCISRRTAEKKHSLAVNKDVKKESCRIDTGPQHLDVLQMLAANSEFKLNHRVACSAAALACDADKDVRSASSDHRNADSTGKRAACRRSPGMPRQQSALITLEPYRYASAGECDGPPVHAVEPNMYEVPTDLLAACGEPSSHGDRSVLSAEGDLGGGLDVYESIGEVLDNISQLNDLTDGDDDQSSVNSKSRSRFGASVHQRTADQDDQDDGQALADLAPSSISPYTSLHGRRNGTATRPSAVTLSMPVPIYACVDMRKKSRSSSTHSAAAAAAVHASLAAADLELTDGTTV